MKILRILPVLATVVALSACASRAPEPLPQASAVAETLRVEMPVDPRDNGLTWAQIDLIASLADEYKARGHGPLVISYPQDSMNAAAAIDAIAEARTRLYDHGLSWRQIAGGAYRAPGQANAPVIFSFTRYQSVAPDCPGGWEDLTRARAGESWERFGCATAANFAAMVSDPRDLIAARGMDPADAARRQTVLDRYRAGEPTGATATDADSGTVSDTIDN